MTTPTLDRVLDAIRRVAGTFTIRFVSEGARRWLGGTDGAGTSKNFRDLLHPDDVERFSAAMPDSTTAFACDLRGSRGATARWVNLRGYEIDGQQPFVVCIVDISVWKSPSNAFAPAAQRDDLTGLPNRAFFKRAVDALIKSGTAVFPVARTDPFNPIAEAAGGIQGALAQGDAVSHSPHCQWHGIGLALAGLGLRSRIESLRTGRDHAAA